jgi:hypothetical protein
MSTLARNIKLLAQALDQQGKSDAPITVAATRAYLRKDFKPAKRGGVLLCGSHELRLTQRAEPESPENHDWVGAL